MTIVLQYRNVVAMKIAGLEKKKKKKKSKVVEEVEKTSGRISKAGGSGEVGKTSHTFVSRHFWFTFAMSVFRSHIVPSSNLLLINAAKKEQVSQPLQELYCPFTASNIIGPINHQDWIYYTHGISLTQ